MATNGAPIDPREPVAVPRSTAMATEPAQTIGEIFADKAMIKPAITAAVGIVSLVFRVTIDDALVDQIATFVTFASMVATVWAAQREAAQRAIAQAMKTREEVYAPATVKAIQDAAIDAGAIAASGQPIAGQAPPLRLHGSAATP